MSTKTGIYGLIVVNALAFVGFGALATIGLAGMLPYGDPRPSAEAVLAIDAAKFIFAPALALLFLSKVAISQFERRSPTAAFVILLLPLLSWPLFAFEAIK